MHYSIKMVSILECVHESSIFGLYGILSVIQWRVTLD